MRSDEKMRAVVTEVFKFDELSEKAKEVARQWWKNLMSDDFQTEANMITETMTESARAKGIEFNGKNTISWDLSYSQGDYVALNKAELSKEKLIKVCTNALNDDEKEMFKFLTDSNILYVTHSIDHHHYYGQQIEVDLEVGYYNENEITETIIDNFIYEVTEKIEKAIKSYVDHVCSELKIYGYREIEYLYSNESVDEMLRINEYEFTEEGKKW
jgi:Icc-related predicted phosphoesterase